MTASWSIEPNTLLLCLHVLRHYDALEFSAIKVEGGNFRVTRMPFKIYNKIQSLALAI